MMMPIQEADDLELGNTAPAVDLSDATTNYNIGLSTEEVAQAVEKYGRNEIPVPVSPLYKLFLKQFTGFLPFLIEIACLISLAIQDYTDFGIIAGILFVNGMLGFREEYHAKKALDEISNSIVSEVRVRRNGEVISIPAAELVPGDICMLVGGNIVPADMKWKHGDPLKIDTAALTGESLPRTYPSTEYGAEILSGTTVASGEAYCVVTAIGISTEIGKAQADVLQDKTIRVVSVFQHKIMTVVQVLVSSCFALVFAVLLVDGLLYGGFSRNVRETVLNSLSILIASIPVALPLVLQVNLALGASFMAKKHNAIVTSIPALQDIASMSMLCSDKTGTLTTAKMSVIDDKVYAHGKYNSKDVLNFAYMASNPDKKDDPIDQAINNAYGARDTSDKAAFERLYTIGFNPIVKRVVACVNSNGKTFTIAKGLPAKILDTSSGGTDDHELQWKVEGSRANFAMVSRVDKGLSTAGYKTLAVAVCDGNARELDNPEWKLVGLLPLLDPPRADTAATINSLHYANISVKMITGDHVNVGRETARLIGLGTNIHAGEEIRNTTLQSTKDLIWEADGFAAVLPSDKREVVLTLRNVFGIVTGMTGDGVNDAPALSAAQVGIAVAGATDAAKNAADLILTESGLSPIYGAVLESRRIFARIKAYVIYRVAASIVLSLTLSTIIFVSGCAIDSLLVIVLALMNDISMIPVAYDNAVASKSPQIPKTRKIVLEALLVGFVQSGLGLLFIFSFNNGGNLGVDLAQCEASTRGFVWFYLVLATEVTIFSVRASSFFWTSMPSIYLILSVLITCIVGAIIAVFASDLSAQNVGYIVAFNVGTFFLMDFLKVYFRRLMHESTETIKNDDLIPPAPKTEPEKFVEKSLRYAVHRASVLSSSDMDHHSWIQDPNAVSRFFGNDQHSLSTGIVVNQDHYITVFPRARWRSVSSPV